MKTIITIVFSLFIFVSQASDPASKFSYHKIKAKKGDGIISLLSRYKLGDNKCNFKAFCDLNSIDKNSALIKDKEYILPVHIYTYNGKSIRTTLGIDEWEKAVRIKEYNEFLKDKKLRQTHYIDSKILWVPINEMDCDIPNNSEESKKAVAKTKETKKEEKLKTTPEKKTTKESNEAAAKTYVTQKVFGKKNEKVEVVDDKLKGHVYYVISGHGGADPGATGNCSNSLLCEDEYAYDVCLRLAKNLMQQGAQVEIIIQDPNDGIRDGKFLQCDHDEIGITGKKLPAKQRPRLVQRSADINALYRKHKKNGAKTQRSIFIHVDSRNVNKKQDVFFYHHKESIDGKKMAYQLQSVFKKKYEKYRKGRGYKGYVDHRNLLVLRYTQPAAVFIELGNIKNSSDQKRILEDSNRQLLANWIFEGVTF